MRSAKLATSALVLHRGARVVSLEELQKHKAPPPEGRWHPIAHARVLSVVTQALTDSGYRIERQQLALQKDALQFFGTLDLSTPVAEGVALAVGIRNSINKTFPLGFCAGNRVFVCDNLAFRSELLVRRKHTTNGERNFVRAIAEAVTGLESFREQETLRVERLGQMELGEDQADALILRAFERAVIGSRELPRVLREWRSPSHDDFKPRTAWSLLNAFTTALQDRARSQPQGFAVQTMRLNALLDPERN